MTWVANLDWSGGGWITPFLHLYALAVFALVVAVHVVHRSRLTRLASRVAAIASQIEGRGPTRMSVPVEQLSAMIFHLGELAERRPMLDIEPVLKYLRKEERQHPLGVSSNLVNLTETMIELFPMLGIFGTVWAISAVGREDFSSDRLLVLFGVAVTTTLWALLYVIVFRIVYSAFVQSRVAEVDEYSRRFQAFLAILERRSGRIDVGVGIDGPDDGWNEPA